MHLTKHVVAAPLLALLLIAAAPSPARADVTAFLSTVNRSASVSSLASSRHAMPGVSFGIGLIVVGFEVEGASLAEDPAKKVAGLRTGMANVLVQTPTGGTQLYATAGGGLYQETQGQTTNTNLATNIGGGLKLALVGPLRLRVDYRIIHLRNQTMDGGTGAIVQRLYAGINVKF